MTKRELRVLAVVSSFAIFWMLTQFVWAAEVPRIRTEELKSMLGNPEVIIIDVRAAGDWDKSRTKIQGAVREDPNKSAKSWAEKYSQDKTIVLYCA
jgi:rhodanese-related sulfurtransferase